MSGIDVNDMLSISAQLFEHMFPIFLLMVGIGCLASIVGFISTERTNMSKYTGKWAWWFRDESMPRVLKLYEGGWFNAREVGTITRFQAMAIMRHWGGKHWECVSRSRKSEHYRDIYVIGDIDAWHEDTEEKGMTHDPA